MYLTATVSRDDFEGFVRRFRFKDCERILGDGPTVAIKLKKIGRLRFVSVLEKKKKPWTFLPFAWWSILKSLRGLFCTSFDGNNKRVAGHFFVDGAVPREWF